MPLVHLTDLISKPDNTYAIGAFNVSDMEMAMGAIKAAEELHAPLILQIAEGRLRYSPLDLLGPVMIAAAKKCSMPTAVHLDHGSTMETIKLALDLGFTSVMFDGSKYPLDENIARTQEVVKLAKGYGADVEGEIGRVGGAEGDYKSVDVLVTSVEEAKRFAEESGIDAMAVAIGTAHGNYKETPKLRIDRLKEIHAAVKTPLVLHGGTGLTEEDFRTCLANGIQKINIATASYDRLRRSRKSPQRTRRQSTSISAMPSYRAPTRTSRNTCTSSVSNRRHEEDKDMALISFDENKKRDVVLIGRVTLDFNPNELNRTLDKVKTFSMYLGGSPGNMAVGINKLGKKVGFIGCVSDDQFGDFVLNYFNERGIDTSQMTRAKNGERMGLTFTEIKSPTESSILMYRDQVADLEIAPEDVDEQYIADSKILIVSGTALSKSPSREACLLAVQYAKKHGTRVIFDIDYRPYSWRSKKDIQIYYSLLASMADVIIGSRDEVNLTEGLDEEATEPADHVIAEKYIEQGAKIVIIKHGKKGSIAYTADKKAYKVESYHIKLLKSFGGGDAYGSAFVYGLLAGWTVSQALQHGTAHAAMVVASHSCSDAMQTVEQIDAFMQEHKDEKVITELDWEAAL